MKGVVYNFLSDETVFFKDTLTAISPYISSVPRNHESLCFVTKGDLLYEKNGNNYIIHTGQVGYIAKGSIDKSSPYNCEQVSYIAVNFGFERENPNLSQTLISNTVCGKDKKKYEQLFFKAYNAFLDKMPGYLYICNGILLQIIGMIYEENLLSEKYNKYADMIKPMLDTIKYNFGDQTLKISHLAEVCNMSDKNLRRIFHYIYGKTPYEYLQKYRIEQAEALLRFSSKSISEIAEQCGFSDIYSFSHCFKRQVGIAPKEYRNT